MSIKMSMDIWSLIESQQEIHGRVSRSMDNLKKLGTSNITVGAVEARIGIIDSLWKKAEAQHDAIRAGLKDKFSESEYAQSDLLEEIESTYVLQKSMLTEYADDLRSASAALHEQSRENAVKTSLPRIKLQTFSGAYEDWPSFRDLFSSVIGKNPAISDVERFHYLRSCTKGAAEKLIRSLTVTRENYRRAWSILCDHYENKRELIRSNFASFIAVPKMKSESAEELSRIHNAVMTAVNAQESIGRPINSNGMDLFNFLVVELLDSRTRMEWESSTSSSTEPPDHDTLLQFMAKRILTLNAAKPKAASKGCNDAPRPVKSLHTKHNVEYGRCVLCQGKHSIMQCSDFKAKSAAERKSFVESHRLCYNCLGSHMISKCQSFKTCLTCKAKHHTMLHDAYVSSNVNEVSTLSAVRRPSECKATLLATARVELADRAGGRHQVRALVDQGSEVSIISEALAQRLRLPRSRSAISIVGIGGIRSGATRGKVTLDLSSSITGTRVAAVAHVLPRLSAYRGPVTKGSSSWPHIHGLKLADPRYLERDPVELLLGAEVCSNIFMEGLRKGSSQDPIAQKTTLGWILSGGSDSTSVREQRAAFQCTIDSELVQLVQQFWEQEKEPAMSVSLKPEDETCEHFFSRTHTRNKDGRYVVRLPFASAPPSLLETRKSAERLLTAMEKRCRHDATFGSLYRDFMSEYQNLQHMSPVKISNGSMCYLPHHGVLREASSCTKLRVVFNGSQRIKTGESLNSHLLVGANLLPTLADILLRWRRHRFVFITDIEKMYRQILIHPEDRRFQRILWRSSANDKVNEYELNTVTYGLACAPFLAVRTLRQLALDEESHCPLGAAALRHDCYVDDIITGANTIQQALSLQSQLQEICTAGGFPLRKWAANNAMLLSGIPQGHQLLQPHHSWENEVHSTLGLRWHPASDEFSFAIQPRTSTALTKRRVLAETARLFDPLGWLAPVISRAKILIQSTWLKRLEWDAPLPKEDEKQWQILLTELSSLSQLRIPRWLRIGSGETHIELHGFSDASERGFAAVVYLCSKSANDSSSHLLAAKSKVAPIKPVTLPRLELCAAALLVNLMNHVQLSLELSAAPVYLWTDSKVTLQWIKGHASRWKTYVANRVSSIQQTLPDAHWRHVPGKYNPADCASRGIAPRDLLHHPLWWTGPDWLRQDPSQWPNGSGEEAGEDVPETKATLLVTTYQTPSEPEILLRFSDLHKLLRVSAWCHRWRRMAIHAHDATLHPDEIDAALLRWLRVVQEIHFAPELAAARNSRPMPHRSNLAKLVPFIDGQGILRVGGRLKNAMLSHDERHPMIAPPDSGLTKLLIESCHRRTLHGGAQLTLGLLRLRFWIPQGRAIVKRVLHRCVTCTRWRALSPQPLMSALPRGRVTPARPFLRTGVDYAGPIFIRSSKGRGHRSHKAFIVVFICLSSRAVHLDVVSDYSSEAFLAAFRRFISRRGLCKEMYSDCGTNFVGADKELRKIFHASSAVGHRIAQAISLEGVSWRFNPPAAPHFGGLWEAAVKSTKYHLRRVIGDTTLTFEEMSTLLAQIEACLNSRPLQALTDDPDDLTALTPGHFLIGAPLLALPESSLAEEAPSRLSRWQLLQQMRDHFWQRWSQEYIHSLTTRPKWIKDNRPPELGSLCLIRSDITPPTRWPLARIIKTHPGADGVIRVVTLRTASSELVRPLTKIVVLPAHDYVPQSNA